MGLLTRYLRRRATRVGHGQQLERIREAHEAVVRQHASGARWRRMGDGSWVRYSHLGEAWEPATPPETLIELAANEPTNSEWRCSPIGVWTREDLPAEP